MASTHFAQSPQLAAPKTCARLSSDQLDFVSKSSGAEEKSPLVSVPFFCAAAPHRTAALPSRGIRVCASPNRRLPHGLGHDPPSPPLPRALPAAPHSRYPRVIRRRGDQSVLRQRALRSTPATTEFSSPTSSHLEIRGSPRVLAVRRRRQRNGLSFCAPFRPSRTSATLSLRGFSLSLSVSR